VPDVKKVELIGVQDEKIYIEMSHAKLATLGLDPLLIVDALRQQNIMVPAGFFETPMTACACASRAISKSVESIREIGIQAERPVVPARRHRHRQARLRRSADAAHARSGRAAIGIAVAMNKGGDVIELGDRLREAEMPACRQICHWASTSTSSPTSRRS
jgi:multidrug efflux pump